jgi:hypothetical protein
MVAQETCRLGEKGIKVVVGLDDLARLSKNNATGRFCLFGGRSHRHGKIVVIVLVLALSLARDRFLIVVAATIIAACPAMVDDMCLIVQTSHAIVTTDPFLASTLVVSGPRFF